MATTVKPKLEIGLGLNKLGLSKGLKDVQRDLQGLDKTAKSTTGIFTKLRNAIGGVFSRGVGVASGLLLYRTAQKLGGALRDLISASLDFDEQMHNVNSVAQLGGKAFGKLTDSVLELAENPKILDMPAALAEGLYTLVSSGYSAADAMTILKAAAMGATAGMTTTAVASDVLVSTLGAYGKSAKDATATMDDLFQIVFISKYTFEQLAQSLATVTPSASKLGISIQEVGAAMATMGRQGTDAQTATVQLNGVLTGLLKPTDAMTALLASLGYASGEAAIQALGFSGVLSILQQATGGSAAKAAELFGDVRALRGILQLTTQDGALYTENLEGMSHAHDGAGATAKALAQQMKSARYQLRLLHKNVVVFFTEGIGGKFTKAIAKAISYVNHFFESFFRARRRGLGFVSAIFVGIRSAILKALGRDTFEKIRPFLTFIEKWFRVIQFVITEVVRVWWILTKTVLSFGLAVAYAVVRPILALISMFKFLKKMGFDTAKSLQIIADSILKFFHLDALIPPIMRFIAWVVKIFGYAKLLIGYLKAVAGGTNPATEAFRALPKPLRDIAYVLGRVVKTFRVFFKTLSEKGLFAALKKLSSQIKTFGAALAWLVWGIFGKGPALKVKEFFDLLAKFAYHGVTFLDDLFHGRWAHAWLELGIMAKEGMSLLGMALSGLWSIVKWAFDQIPWGPIGDALWAGLQIAWKFLEDVAAPWLAEKVKKYAQEAWGAIPWTEIGDTIWDGIQIAYDFTTDKLTWLAGKSEKLIKDAWNAIDWNAVGQIILDGLTTALEFVWGHPESLAVGAAAAGLIAFGPVGGIIAGIIAFGIIHNRKKIGTALSKALSSLGSNVKIGGKAFVLALPDLTVQGFAIAGQLINGIYQGIMDNRKLIGEAFLAVLVGLPALIGFIVGEIIGALAEAIVKHPMEVANALIELLLIAAAIVLLVMFAPEIIAVAFIAGLIVGLVYEFETKVWPWLKGIGALMWLGARVGIEVGWTLFLDAVTILWNGFISWVEGLLGISSPSTVAASWGSSLIDGLVQGLSDTVGSLWTWLSTNLSPDKIASYIGNWYQAAVSWGASLINGLGAGIASVWNTLVGWMDSIIDQLSRIPDWLRPGSPSKTMAVYGLSAATGLAKGIEKGMPSLHKAIGGMTSALGAGNANRSPAFATSIASGPSITAGNGAGGFQIDTFENHNHFPEGVTDPETLAQLSAKYTLRALREIRAGKA